MSDSEFRAVFELLVSLTDEYTHLLPLFEASILPRLPKTDALLDVGAGPGLITSPLSKHFDHISLVEPDPLYCLEAVRKILASGKPVTAFNRLWEVAQLEQQRYDLVVCAHVLYFVDPEKWAEFIQKMMAQLASGGRLVIVLVAKGDDVSELIRRELGIEELGSHPFSAAAIEILRTRNYPFERLSFEAAVTAETAETLMGVMSLFPIMQYDTGSTAEQRLALIEEHFKGEDRYLMPYTVDAVVVEAAA